MGLIYVVATRQKFVVVAQRIKNQKFECLVRFFFFLSFAKLRLHFILGNFYYR